MFKYLNNKYFLIPFSLFLFLSGYIFINNYSFSRATPYFYDQITNDPDISVTESNDTYILKPKARNSIANLIFLTGGLVDEKAYLYNLGQLSKYHSITVFVPKIKLKLAFLDQEAIMRTVKNFNVKEYYVSGHSLGGVVACYHIRDHKDTKGLILMASYCDNSIKEFKGQVLQITGSNDKVINKTKLNEKKLELPEQTQYYEILDGIHSQFGNYGPQKGDGTSNLLDAEALSEIITASKKIVWDK